MNKAKLFFILLYVVLLIIPGVTLIRNNNGVRFDIYFFLQLCALYAITLMFAQVILGGFMRFFAPIFSGPKARAFHITQGILAYGFIVAHPLLYLIFVGQNEGVTKALVSILPSFANQMELYIDFGKLGFVLVSIGVLAGWLRQNPLVVKYWRKLHVLNYVAFSSIVIHSWFMGSDTHTAPFVYLYPVFIVGFFAAVFYRLKPKFMKTSISTSN